MDNSTEHEAAWSDMDHGLRDVDALLAVADEAFPLGHPTAGRLDDPAPWQYLRCLASVIDGADLI